jgi:replicative DNA helicase
VKTSGSSTERSLLGAIMLDETMMATLPLEREDFLDPRHRYLWDLLSTRYRRGLPLSLDSVIDDFGDSASIEEAGGWHYVSGHGDNAAYPAIVERYVLEIRERRHRYDLTLTVEDVRVALSQNDELPGICESLMQAVSRASVVQRLSLQDRLLQQREVLLEEAAGDRRVFIPTGIIEWDDNVNFQGLSSEGMTLFLGASGMGKTSVLNRIAIGLLQQGISVYLHGTETSEDRRLRDMVFSIAGVDGRAWARLTRGIGDLKIAGKSIDPVLDGEVQAQLHALQSAEEWLSQQPIHITGSGMTVERVSAEAHYLFRQDRCSVVICDYLQDLADSRGHGIRLGDRVQQVAHKSATLKDLAAKLQIPVVAGAQVSGEKLGVEGRDPKPQLWDVQWSSTAHQDAEEVYALYRDDYYRERYAGWQARGQANTIEVIARKRRTGKLGFVEFPFHGPTKWVGKDTISL